SHDRALIDTVATHTLSLEGGTALMRAGGYGDLLAARQDAGVGAGDAGKPPAGSPARAGTPPGKRAKARSGEAGGGEAPRRSNGRLAREVSKIESRIAGIEAEMAQVEAEVAEAGAAGDIDAVTRLGERHRALQEDLSYAMAEWEDRAAMLVEGT
ncbi:MAG: hypothetical protein KGQ95_00370, partial [Acidobacteria bacterium]|nr:hypothetical protein [Acidobacteriota bacterium]